MSGPHSSHPHPPYEQTHYPSPQPDGRGPGHRSTAQRSLPLLILAISIPALVLGVALGVAGTLLAPALLASPAAPAAAQTMVVSGTMALDDGFGVKDAPCSGDGGYSDIREGAQVVITDASSATLAVGALRSGRRNSTGDCEFPFTVGGVPTGHQFYGIEISHRGRLQYPAAKLKTPLQLSLGN